MGLFSLEHSKPVYWADFALHGAAALALTVALVLHMPVRGGGAALALVAAGWALWSLVEYVLHRFVLHGVAPFDRWHRLHHARPTALICGPTLLSAGLLAALVFAPAWWLLPHWAAEALTLGVVLGYLVYGLVHHATHHGGWRGPWLQQRRRWHALHHHGGGTRCYGVSTAFWDRRLGSGP